MDNATAKRFWAKVKKTDTCWIWTGAKTAKGYGTFQSGGRVQYAHRMAIAETGIDPSGRTVDHVCHNRSCVRGEHLRLVTSKQNSENLAGAHRDNKSGVRGVSWDKRNQKWQARVYSQGAQAHKRFEHLRDAEAWVVARRNELFTHNDADRIA